MPLPTAVFSTHTAIPNWVTTDLTSAMQGTIEQYDALGLRFEAVYAGFLGSADQIDRVREAAQRLKTPDGITLIDPVMGDNGKVYDTYTPEMCTRMRELCAIADIITPNYYRSGDPDGLGSVQPPSHGGRSLGMAARAARAVRCAGCAYRAGFRARQSWFGMSVGYRRNAQPAPPD